MLNLKIDRLNELELTLDEINEIKSQLMAELERIEKIESDTISEVSDLQSEILSTTQVVVVPTEKLADATLKDSQLLSYDNWENLTKDSGIWLSNNQVYIYQHGKIIDTSEISEGGTNSPLQKAIDTLYGYSQARYYYSSFTGNKLPELNPCYNPATGKKSRHHWHGNHCRKQVWYSYCTNTVDWFYIDWTNTSPEYWIDLTNEINNPKPQENKPIYNPVNRGRGSYKGSAIRSSGDVFPNQDELIAKYWAAFA
jgi:hypothetical protein